MVDTYVLDRKSEESEVFVPIFYDPSPDCRELFVT